VLCKPLGNAVSAEKVRTARQLGAAPNHMDLADFADELFRFTEQLVLLHLHLLNVQLLPELHFWFYDVTTSWWSQLCIIFDFGAICHPYRSNW